MRRVADGVVGGEPFFRVLRERHPDADLVILPPIEATPPDQALAPVDEVVAVARAARTALDELLAAIGQPQPDARHDGWRAADSPFVTTYVARAALRGIPDGEAIPLLRTIGDTLLAQGWDARQALDRAAGIVAGDGRHVIEAEVVAGSIDLRLDSRPVVAAPGTIEAADEVLR